MPDSDVKAKCSDAVAAIAALPRSQWRQWAVYVLKALHQEGQRREWAGRQPFGTAYDFLFSVRRDLEDWLRQERTRSG